jgi:NAD(P)-dependent dehydrogenase (short-subunit alcohol dehydrogenase family)
MTTYFISGASSGLGREMARRLAARGDTVVAAARRTDALADLAQEVAGAAGSLVVRELDVTDAASVDRVMREVDQTLGGLDVVVVNAGRGGGSPLGSGEADRNRAVLAVNLLGALAQIETAMSLFRHRGRGHLVLVSSMAAGRGLPGGSAAYSAGKAALASLGSSLRAEFTGTGVAVTTLRPGYISTPLTARNRSPLVTSLERGVDSMIRAMDRRRGDVVVPAWPWAPLDLLLRMAPRRLLRRFS